MHVNASERGTVAVNGSIQYRYVLNIIYDILAQIVHLRHVAAKHCSSFYFEQDAFNDDDGEGEDSHFSPILLAPFTSRSISNVHPFCYT